MTGIMLITLTLSGRWRTGSEIKFDDLLFEHGKHIISMNHIFYDCTALRAAVRYLDSALLSFFSSPLVSLRATTTITTRPS